MAGGVAESTRERVGPRAKDQGLRAGATTHAYPSIHHGRGRGRRHSAAPPATAANSQAASKAEMESRRQQRPQRFGRLGRASGVIMSALEQYVTR